MMLCSLLSRKRTGARVKTGVTEDLLSGILCTEKGRREEWGETWGDLLI